MRWVLLVALLLGVAFIVQENDNGANISRLDTSNSHGSWPAGYSTPTPDTPVVVPTRVSDQAPAANASPATPVPTTVPNTPVPTGRDPTSVEEEGARRKDTGVLPRPSLLNSDVDLRSILCSKPWPCEEALATVDCESKGNTNERSATGDYGLLGINYEAHKDRVFQVTGGWDAESLLDPWVNVEVGFMIYSGDYRGGWDQWVCVP